MRGPPIDEFLCLHFQLREYPLMPCPGSRAMCRRETLRLQQLSARNERTYSPPLLCFSAFTLSKRSLVTCSAITASEASKSWNRTIMHGEALQRYEREVMLHARYYTMRNRTPALNCSTTRQQLTACARLKHLSRLNSNRPHVMDTHLKLRTFPSLHINGTA